MALLATVVRRAVKELEGPDLDRAAAGLAVKYAVAIDEDDTRLEKLGPQLQSLLESLLMTPRARAVAVKGGRGDDKRVDPLDELRARRAARVNNPPAVDTPAP